MNANDILQDIYISPEAIERDKLIAKERATKLLQYCSEPEVGEFTKKLITLTKEAMKKQGETEPDPLPDKNIPVIQISQDGAILNLNEIFKEELKLASIVEGDNGQHLYNYERKCKVLVPLDTPILQDSDGFFPHTCNWGPAVLTEFLQYESLYDKTYIRYEFYFLSSARKHTRLFKEEEIIGA